jgi:hypothetical protein
MQRKHLGSAKPIVFIVLAILICIAAYIMVQEQNARTASMEAHNTLVDLLDSGETLTPDVVQEKVGRAPVVTRTPGKHKLVEEYTWSGPMSEHRVYAYYKTAATQLLEAVSINQEVPEWETDE